MDQHHSRHPGSATPIYDRLLAEWRAAHAEPAPDPAPAHLGGLVPPARTSAETGGRG
ncbi:hypothetical protein [Streptomyces sp. SID7909]|uniref:hypothetical protein n=1 Tax=unclassified Streptomyces TaxID=2593676 RepID=UPI0019449C1E|nr:hypothetical protein [Streptomyces sp. SID7909]